MWRDNAVLKYSWNNNIIVGMLADRGNKKERSTVWKRNKVLHDKSSIYLIEVRITWKCPSLCRVDTRKGHIKHTLEKLRTECHFRSSLIIYRKILTTRTIVQTPQNLSGDHLKATIRSPKYCYIVQISACLLTYLQKYLTGIFGSRSNDKET